MPDNRPEDEIFQQGRGNDDIPDSSEITEDDLGVRGVPDTIQGQQSAQQTPNTLRDTFFGPRDKRYLDFIARRVTKLRGTNAYYYLLRSQTERTDDILPVSKNRIATPQDTIRHAGGTTSPHLTEAMGIAAMYGEPVVVGQRLNSVEREFTPTWDFAEPVLVRGVLTDPERAEIPDQRGSIYTQRIRISLARTLCENDWYIRPRVGDMIRIPDLTNPPRLQDNYYDVEEVVINDTRFGGTGHFTAFTLQLSRSTRHAPQRKIPEKDKRDAPDPPV
jgi:hypothetical protein